VKKLTLSMMLIVALVLIAGCGGSHAIKRQVIEQVPAEMPCWAEGKSCDSCVDLPEGVKCFVGFGNEMPSFAGAEDEAYSDVAVQIIAKYIGFFTDSDIQSIIDNGTGSDADRASVKAAQVTLTIGESMGGLERKETYRRIFTWSTDPTKRKYDFWALYQVDENVFTDMLAEQLEKAAQEREGAISEALSKRSQMVRDRYHSSRQ
jgi:hypothetical protein